MNTNDTRITTDMYKVDVTSENKVYYPCSLPYRSQMVLRNRFGTKEVTKEIINYSHSGAMINSWQVYTDVDGDKIGICELPVCLSVNNKVVMTRIHLFRDSVTRKYKLGMNVNDLYYEVVSIDGKEMEYFAPHIELLLGECK